MGAISQMHFCEWKFCILIRISLKFLPKGVIDNMSALVQVMAWFLTGGKPLPEPMMTQFTDIYVAQGGDELSYKRSSKMLNYPVDCFSLTL